jgi:hypothetical protein
VRRTVGNPIPIPTPSAILLLELSPPFPGEVVFDGAAVVVAVAVTTGNGIIMPVVKVVEFPSARVDVAVEKDVKDTIDGMNVVVLVTILTVTTVAVVGIPFPTVDSISDTDG